MARRRDPRAAAGPPDALVAGIETGGTLIGVGRAFREANPGVEVIALEPDESCTIVCGEIAPHAIEGIADGFVPGIVAAPWGRGGHRRRQRLQLRGADRDAPPRDASTASSSARAPAPICWRPGSCALSGPISRRW